MKRLWTLVLLTPVLLTGCHHCCGLFGGRLLNPLGTTALSPAECCDPCVPSSPCDGCATDPVLDGNLVPVQPTYETPSTTQKPPT